MRIGSCIVVVLGQYRGCRGVVTGQAHGYADIALDNGTSVTLWRYAVDTDNDWPDTTDAGSCLVTVMEGV